VSQRDLMDAFADHVLSFIDLSALRPLKVVADTANGMGGLVVPRIFAKLPIDLEILFGDLDGSFPNHPADPIQPENLKDLQARVLDTGADVGLAFDGDADRVFLVDDKAQPVSGSLTTAMVAKAVLEKHAGEKVIYNLICSKAVPEVIRENGGTPIRSRVGHSFIKGLMAETGAVFAGEHSGHYYFRENYRADSGLIAAVIVLELLSKAAAPLSDLRKPFDRYAASGEINTEVRDPHAVIERVAEAYAGRDQDRLDGLTVDMGDWWFNLRPSNTEPLLRLNLEAATPEACAEHTDELLALIKGHEASRAGPDEEVSH
jgi:phosphomannomutase